MPALVDLGASVIIQNSDHDYLFVTNLPPAWSAGLGDAPSDQSLFGSEIAQKLADLKRGLTESGQKGHAEFSISPDEVYEFRVQGVELTGRGLYLVTTIVDRSEERHRERLLRALLREVSHRSKNLLAIIQSIALQTARYSVTLDMFLNKFRGRLYSLSQSQDLITDSSWRGAYFFELVRQQTEKYLPDNAHLVRISGDDVLLTPNASLHLGLALHELIVNAVSHGSLVKSGRAIGVSCHKVQINGHDSLEVRWDEGLGNPHSRHDGFSLDDTLKANFGSTVLERVVPASVNGKARYQITQDRISYSLVFPIDHAAE
ncbi:sensor histidine kinase [Rhizobium sp. SSA_523]|uniref:sensor histidine kinase n=1 Tax=Rhizobium sp. SSA_523 TaxID=2952477 RepID=UPI002091C5E9|nr:sensor histidine kinase [Rhizobium sp. SSA_523]MCO5731779.1 sensor histidine kinase [Rhizobium sp. SSA_523]WKC22852.1 sensor histidine kinase [Rhizobium sp. SSA_523]